MPLSHSHREKYSPLTFGFPSGVPAIAHAHLALLNAALTRRKQLRPPDEEAKPDLLTLLAKPARTAARSPLWANLLPPSDVPHHRDSLSKPSIRYSSRQAPARGQSLCFRKFGRKAHDRVTNACHGRCDARGTGLSDRFNPSQAERTVKSARGADVLCG
jgi:hypothetical protein